MSMTDIPTRDAGFDKEDLAAVAPERDFSHSRAVVIGINEYGNGIPSLSTAVNDARRLAEILQAQHNYEVELLLDEQATLAGLQQLLDVTDSTSFVSQVGAEDRVLLYFAGHGVAMPSDEGPVGYLVPQDGRLTEAETTFWPMRALYAALDSLTCRHLLIILDCCFAGAFRWSVPATRFVPPPRQLYAERYRRYIRHVARQAITSAGDDQKALDVATTFFNQRQVAAADEKHSPFALALFQALSDSTDKVITATELYLHLRDAVEAEADSRRHQQTPGLWPLRNHDKGE